MNLSLGIVGLPNVGKSTLFNALTKQQVTAANYPFATIDPNHGIVPVSDERLNKIAEVEKPEKVVPAVVEFVDIAGLVKGASEGEGLGNQFLGNIKSVNAIVHVVRAFKHEDITHVEDSIDPKRDIELINTELILKDIDTVQKRVGALESKARTDAKLKLSVEHLQKLLSHLEDGKLAKEFAMPIDETAVASRKELFLLTDKRTIYLINVEDERAEESKNAIQAVVGEGSTIVTIDIKQEAELSEMSDEDRQMFMEDLGLDQTGLSRLTKLAYDTLGLISFFTSGPKEVRAWTIRQGETAPEAAGTIHGDIQENFIAADVVGWHDFVELGGWLKSRDAGKVRLEGKTYVMQDGDVVLFKHNG